jgi:Flp pilus assembly protein TadG
MSPTRKNERGAIMLLFGMAVLSLFLVSALALDMGSAYVTTASLSKAVDAGALAGARYTMKGESIMQDVINQVATANYGVSDNAQYEPTYQITIWQPALDTTRVRVEGATKAPTYFSKLIGREEIPVTALAEATRYPLDMSLVLDLSYSLERNNAFDDMQDAASGFLEYFDDNIDRFGLVTYSTWGEERMPLQKLFKNTGQSIIDSLSAISDTNIEEGIRLAKAQLDVASPRTEALKIMVLFTDGRPTAFADEFTMEPGNNNPTTYDGVVATYISGSSYRGLFQTGDGYKIDYFDGAGQPVLVANGSSASSPKPSELPGGASVNGQNIRALGADQAEAWANTVRSAGYTIFAIALGNPNATSEGDTPDLDFLARIANADSIVSSDQPKGELLFSPTPSELEATFAMLADRIITRLTR